ncbi:MAG TPA: UdgX family uracil-DNA binding protein [Burkholderiales bacterium]|nr:UdgX family uracil-DNA binding protein [Burkholderiales bacterium]
MSRNNPNQTLENAREEAASCRACPLWQSGTQTVFGAGDADAKVMLVGEQPGDEEDLRGEPFVGPAGKLLDRALIAAGVDRSQVYVTNAVKHFKWEPRGKRRLHKTPAQREIDACRQWLEREIAIVKPKVIVCLGGTAVKALLGPKVKVLANRGVFLASPFAENVLITVHPSSVLRAPEEDRASAFQALVKDLKRIKSVLK